MTIDDLPRCAQVGFRSAFSPAWLRLALAACRVAGPRSHGRDPTRSRSRACEEILLSSGLVDAAHARYGIRANQGATFLATFRSIAKKYRREHPRRFSTNSSRALPPRSLAQAIARQVKPDRPATLMTDPSDNSHHTSYGSVADRSLTQTRRSAEKSGRFSRFHSPPASAPVQFDASQFKSAPNEIGLQPAPVLVLKARHRSFNRTVVTPANLLAATMGTHSLTRVPRSESAIAESASAN